MATGGPGRCCLNVGSGEEAGPVTVVGRMQVGEAAGGWGVWWGPVCGPGISVK